MVEVKTFLIYDFLIYDLRASVECFPQITQTRRRVFPADCADFLIALFIGYRCTLRREDLRDQRVYATTGQRDLREMRYDVKTCTILFSLPGNPKMSTYFNFPNAFFILLTASRSCSSEAA